MVFLPINVKMSVKCPVIVRMGRLENARLENVRPENARTENALYRVLIIVYIKTSENAQCH